MSTGPAPRRRLGDLRCGTVVVGHVDDRGIWVQDTEIGHRVDAHGDIVAGNDLLRWDVERHRAQIDLLHALDEGH